MYLKLRTKKILEFLFNQTDYISAKKISNKFNVSTRTIRYDLDEIEDLLKSYNILMYKVPKLGILIKSSKEQKYKVLNELNSKTPEEVFLTNEQKKKYIISRLLAADKPITIGDLSEELCLGKSVVAKTLKDVEIWFQEKNIQLIKKTKKGIFIKTTESDWRKSVTELLSYEIDSKYIVRYLEKLSSEIIDTSTSMDYVSSQYFNMIFNGIDIRLLGELITRLEKETDTKLVDSSFIALMVHIALAVKRLKSKKAICFEARNLEKIMNNHEFNIIKSVVNEYQEKFDVVINDDEIGYITLHLLGSKTKTHRKQEDDNTLKDLSLRLINNIDKKISEKILIDDQLIKGIMLHLEPALVRMSNKMFINNPMLNEIKVKYKNVFNVVKIQCENLFRNYGVDQIPDDEVAYITLHIGASIERSKRKIKNEIRALLVCGSGFGTVKMLSSRMKYEFPKLEIVKEVSVLDITDDDLNSVDLIIATVDFDISSNKKVVKVSPLLTMEDIKKIETFLNVQFIAENNKYKPNIMELLSIIEKHCEIQDRDSLTKELKIEFFQYYEKGEDLPMLSDVLKEENINLCHHANNWEESVYEAGRLLVEADCAESRYIDAMIESVKELGPYIVIAKGIAMPHARPGNGSKKVSMSLVRLDKPVEFGNKDNDPVDLVFALSATDNNSHLKVMADLSSILSNENYIRILRESKDIREVLNLIENVSEGRSINEWDE
ncbi:BglG family transcription antiterminator [Alkalibacter saccharofermentans]|uniref:Transcriptional antiterminator, BglG family n=1 Tax=Alkalibacter saccharofermentans DSM 14828 TaxID=1120975 RepID=A0A1M4UZ50_9FIRM|nr:BglG family transcription antiterminator [Alkalibacter saccharofermentans]SHE61945.1 transcriptional antiterminator, BglG family [Alkalibacter saccharofermentans DSM 14828]